MVGVWEGMGQGGNKQCACGPLAAAPYSSTSFRSIPLGQEKGVCMEDVRSEVLTGMAWDDGMG